MRLAAVVCFAVAALANQDVPTQVHINQGDQSGQAMTISWITTTTTDGMVQYGKDPNNLNMKQSQQDAPSSYVFRSYYESKSYKSGLIHHTTIGDLDADTTYYYQCGDGSAMSKTFSFKTPPKLGSFDNSFVLNLIGDLGQTSDSMSTLDHIRQDETAHMTILVGDLSYADSAERSTLTRNCSQRRWDSWGEKVEPTFANQPVMVLPGNHEIEQEGPLPATQDKFVAFQARFRMPSASSGAQHGNLYYSFNVGPVHVIMLNSYMDFDHGSDQYQWLEKDLARIERSVTPWVMCNMHAPWYNSDVHHHNETEEFFMRQAMEPLLHQYNVDLVFSGHVHAYERMYPVYNNKTSPGSTTFINIGDGGNREGPAYGYYPQPEWSAYREPAFGHGRLEFFNASHAHWTWHKNANQESVVSDNVWLVKNTYLKNGLEHGVSHFGPHHDGADYIVF